jgi:transposase-like protein
MVLGSIEVPRASVEDCVEFFYRMKWPNGFRCPQCGFNKAYTLSNRRLPLYECIYCSHQTSLIVGTILEKSRTCIKKWFIAIYLLSLEKSVSAQTLSHTINVTYKTAWLMLHKIRHAMSEVENDTKLTGTISVNSAFYGRPYNPTIHKHPKETPVWIGASMGAQDQPTFLKFRKVPDEHMYGSIFLKYGAQVFSEKHIEPNPISTEIVIQRYVPRSRKKALPSFLQASAWLWRTFRGIGPKHLQSYFDEFCCRFNLAIKYPDVFARLLHITATCRTITGRTLIERLPA